MNTVDTNSPALPIEKSSIWSRLKKPSKKMFWVWVAYQTVKGTLTTALIWIPLLYVWLQS